MLHISFRDVRHVTLAESGQLWTFQFFTQI